MPHLFLGKIKYLSSVWGESSLNRTRRQEGDVTFIRHLSLNEVKDLERHYARASKKSGTRRNLTRRRAQVPTATLLKDSVSSIDDNKSKA